MTAENQPDTKPPKISQETRHADIKTHQLRQDQSRLKSKIPGSWLQRFVTIGVWLITVALVAVLAFLVWQKNTIPAEAVILPTQETRLDSSPKQTSEEANLPVYNQSDVSISIHRHIDLVTVIPNRPREDVVEYKVDVGDSVFAIAKYFNLQPETVLWANYDQLQDAPDSLSVDMVLNIPPVDGVYYEWKEGDTIEGVANSFKAESADILNWSGNKLDLTNPVIEPGQHILVPGGEREFRSWIVPQIARGSAGVSKAVYGPGACEGSYEGLYGGGGFIWPTANNFLSGNDFWSGHLGIDIAGAVGDSVRASDSGVIVFSGWATGGYGYMIMIDHGNGYQSVYAHLSSVGVGCGQSVYQGNYIGAVGSTGNSTGSHLHFEVRIWGQFVNPWHVLP